MGAAGAAARVPVVNEPLESISTDLGFAGNTLAEGLVVSICLGGAFIGCLFSGSIADGIGRRRAFQLSALPMIVGAAIRNMENCIFGICNNAMGERRELNPRMVDSQSTALIHLATSAPYPAKGFSLFSIHHYSIYSDLHTSIEIVDIGCHSLK
nr:unnamed protein product [Digitaria exilis]